MAKKEVKKAKGKAQLKVVGGKAHKKGAVEASSVLETMKPTGRKEYVVVCTRGPFKVLARSGRVGQRMLYKLRSEKESVDKITPILVEHFPKLKNHTGYSPLRGYTMRQGGETPLANANRMAAELKQTYGIEVEEPARQWLAAQAEATWDKSVSADSGKY